MKDLVDVYRELLWNHKTYMDTDLPPEVLNSPYVQQLRGALSNALDGIETFLRQILNPPFPVTAPGSIFPVGPLGWPAYPLYTPPRDMNPTDPPLDTSPSWQAKSTG